MPTGALSTTVCTKRRRSSISRSNCSRCCSAACRSVMSLKMTTALVISPDRARDRRAAHENIAVATPRVADEFVARDGLATQCTRQRQVIERDQPPIGIAQCEVLHNLRERRRLVEVLTGDRTPARFICTN